MPTNTNAPIHQDILDTTKQLVAMASVSPDGSDCQQLMAEQLEEMGFVVEHLPFGDVPNLWAKLGVTSPLFVFAGHTDVVPPGPLDQWQTPPYTPTLREGRLYGRGTADMKGSLAAMLCATRAFLEKHPEPRGSIGFLITGDEEAEAVNGTAKVVDHLQKHGVHMDWCVVGEPSSTAIAGDVVRVGRRGSLSGDLLIKGKQGHVAYPEKAPNPVHQALSALQALVTREWDQGNAYFPPTTFQISNVHAGTGVANVIPGDLHLQFNFRFSTENSAQDLKQSVTDLLDSHDLDYTLQWHLSGQPFLTGKGQLVEAVRAAIKTGVGTEPELSTSGGTSDGRFIAPLGTEVVELGPVNDSIHQIDENVSLTDLMLLAGYYEDILKRLLT